MPSRIAQVCAPELRQRGVAALQRVVQHTRTTASATRGLDDRQGDGRRAEAAALDEVDGRDVTASQAGTRPVNASAAAGHGHLYDLWCKRRQFEPPCCGQTACDCGGSVAPHRGANPCRVSELTIVGEEDAGCATCPTAGSNP